MDPGPFRLAPQDYHRFHSPIDGVVGDVHDIPGQYYTGQHPYSFLLSSLRSFVPLRRLSAGGSW